ncbi:MAG: endonuclease/exonuclease/phosphatase family protein [Verrucomicrobiota bacterium]
MLLKNARLLCLALVALIFPAHAEEPDRAPPLKVMSFNIRHGAAKDGNNHWDNRKNLVAETIRVFDPDLLGLQECLDFQGEFLREQISGYTFHGVGRTSGSTDGEFVPVMYKTARFELVDSGHYWLSETPEIPGSKSWDSSLPRMVSWVRLKDKLDPGRAPFVFANAHFDHKGKEARHQSAKLMWRQHIGGRPDEAVILTGDFNAGEGSDPYKALVQGVGQREDGDRPLVDTYRAIHVEKNPNESTFTRWTGNRVGARIDWVLHSDRFTTLSAEINYTNDGGQFPSDHYPVQAVVRRLR